MSFEYLSVDQDKFVKCDVERKVAIVLSISELQEEYRNVLKEIEDLPPPVSDADLLAWARQHYPGVDYEPRRAFLEARKTEIETDLGVME